MKTEGCRGKAVIAYNRREEYEQKFPSMRECARTLDVDASTVGRAAKTGQWVFGIVNVKVRRVG